MSKILKRVSVCVLYYIIIFSTIFTCFASGTDSDQNSVEKAKGVIGNVLNAILDALAWFAYAIALGCLIFIGIKYVLSGANERANLKGMLPRYLIGIALIVMCFAIAQAVAKLAGNNSASEVIEAGGAGASASTGGSSGGSSSSYNSSSSGTYKTVKKKGGNITINYPTELVDGMLYEDGYGTPEINAHLNYGGKSFSHWEVVRTSNVDGSVENISVEGSRFVFEGSEGNGFSNKNGVEYTYEITPIYN